jgi:hypothetical protein
MERKLRVRIKEIVHAGSKPGTSKGETVKDGDKQTDCFQAGFWSNKSDDNIIK